METIDITELARISGVRSSAIRFYEEKGLIFSCGRRGLTRLFRISSIQRLAFIKLGIQAGFSLDEIARITTSQGTLDRKTLLAKAQELEKKIQHLTAMARGLRHAANCSAKSHFECPTFLKLLRIATRPRRLKNSLKNRRS